MEESDIYGNGLFTFKIYVENNLSEKNISKRDFMKFMGWNKVSYDANLSDISNLRLRYIQKIAEFLSLKYDELIIEVLKFEKYQTKK
ncbi:MAG: hypothetical protein RLZZ414_2022 [Bacteroidota bacterium]|jgi:negative regulator of sigma E activity